MAKMFDALFLAASVASVGTASADTITFYAEDQNVNTLLSSSLPLDIEYNSSLWSSIQSATLSLFLSDDQGQGDGNDRADITAVEGNSVTFGDFQITQGTTPTWQSANTYAVPLAYLTDGTLNFVLAAVNGDFYYHNASLEVNFTPVPEPTTTALLGSGLLVAGLALRRRVS